MDIQVCIEQTKISNPPSNNTHPISTTNVSENRKGGNQLMLRFPIIDKD